MRWKNNQNSFIIFHRHTPKICLAIFFLYTHTVATIVFICSELVLPISLSLWQQGFVANLNLFYDSEGYILIRTGSVSSKMLSKSTLFPSYLLLVNYCVFSEKVLQTFQHTVLGNGGMLPSTQHRNWHYKLSVGWNIFWQYLNFWILLFPL